jgi:BlaI family transcriptional regulator, penicillinase repressor
LQENKETMKRLTAKEEEVMDFYWDKGPLFVKQLLEFYDEPKPHFNTLSTIVRGLEEKGFLSHQAYGNTYQYFSVVSKEAYSEGTLKNVVAKYFNNSYFNVISSLVKEEDISVSELKQLIEEVEKNQKGK